MRAVAIILAAGKGTRMRSDRAKVLHPFLGEPLILHPLRAARSFGAERVIVVVGHMGKEVEAAVGASDPGVEFALQSEQRGTGHAVLCALPALGEFEGVVAILSGDVPLLSAATLSRLASECGETHAGLSLATFRPEDPTGYGRILRGEGGGVVGIREQRDASERELAIRECNAGVYCVSADVLRGGLPKLGSENAAGEIYLTDLVAMRAGEGRVGVVEVDAIEVAGVNTPEQLSELERVARGSPRS